MFYYILIFYYVFCLHYLLQQLERLGVLPINLRGGWGRPETWHQVPQGPHKGSTLKRFQGCTVPQRFQIKVAEKGSTHKGRTVQRFHITAPHLYKGSQVPNKGSDKTKKFLQKGSKVPDKDPTLRFKDSTTRFQIEHKGSS